MLKTGNEWRLKIVMSAAAAFLIAVFITAAAKEYHMIKCVYLYHTCEVPYNPEEVALDIKRISELYADTTVGMGCGGNPKLTWFYPILIFAGNPYLFDTSSIDDIRASGLNISSELLEALDSCRIKIWLMPKGTPPFEERGLFPNTRHVQLFSVEFKNIFFKRYKLKEQTTYFDVWSCKDF